MKIYLRKIINKLDKYYQKITLMIFGLILAGVAFADTPAGGDALSDLKPQVTSTFGHGSTIQYILLVGEILIAVYAFIKARNPIVLTGIVILVLFTAFAPKLIGG